MSHPPIQMRRVLKASREKVFEALTDPDLIRLWMCPKDFEVILIETDPRIGGRFRLEMRAPDGGIYPATGAYEEIRAPEKLVYSWLWEPIHALAGIETRISVELTRQGAETLLVMTHFGLPTENERRGHQKGWTGGLDKLELLFQ
ncbi:MAG: Activator of Hsp90 ATPase 1 family protein [Rhizobium sp.]|nr:Activator of Hsp90 ATPase 1 family protein [Rhizobium sp.]